MESQNKCLKVPKTQNETSRARYFIHKRIRISSLLFLNVSMLLSFDKTADSSGSRLLPSSTYELTVLNHSNTYWVPGHRVEESEGED